MIRLAVAVALAATLLLTGLAPEASAIDLRNEDSRAYKVVVRSSHMRRTMKLPPKSLSIVICARTCTVVIPGVGKVRASGQDDVTIRNGRVLRSKISPE